MEKPIFDYSKLRGRIREKCGTQKRFAAAMGMSPATVSLKLANKRYFNQSEIVRAVDVLDIEYGKSALYFFAQRI